MVKNNKEGLCTRTALICYPGKRRLVKIPSVIRSWPAIGVSEAVNSYGTIVPNYERNVKVVLHDTTGNLRAIFGNDSLPLQWYDIVPEIHNVHCRDICSSFVRFR